jgi:Sulfotransferase family
MPMTAVSFEVESIMADAHAQTGLADFGADPWREALTVLAASLDREANLHAIGRSAQRQRLVDSLAVRLTFVEACKRSPEILGERIDDPLVIVGLARTGTTMLHRLISSDPGLYSARWWEVRFPAPFAGWDWRGPDRRIAAAREQVQAILATMPVLAAIHPWDAEGPDEEIMLMEHAFVSHVPESTANLPSYRAWIDRRDQRAQYAYLKKLLQYLQWQKKKRGERADRWVLKAPTHQGNLDRLFETFPGAVVIHTHRDPVETIASVASMYFALWGLNTDAPDPLEIGNQVLDRYARAAERSIALRETIPKERIVDVSYRDVARDPVGTVRAIYAQIGRALTPEAEVAMHAWVAKNPREHRPPHEYTAEKFGLSRERIERACPRYRARFVA